MLIYSWNINSSSEAWRELAESGADFALVQEAREPPPGLGIEVDGAPWETAGADVRRPWRTAVAQLRKHHEVTWRPCSPIAAGKWGEPMVSRPGTLAVADVGTEAPITLVSAYAAWEGPAKETGSRWQLSDVAAHRLVSDISILIGQQKGHRIIVAGDWNILHGYGDYGSEYWRRRYMTVFDRMHALGLPFVGPQLPHGGHPVSAKAHPTELPNDSKNVPTFRRGNAATNATRQLDFVFASESIAQKVKTRALNGPKEWGPSDHCRIEIKVSV
jgi:hypothetical protein